MRGIGKLLLFDEGIILQPVEQLRAVGADHLGLRIVNVGVDKPRHDERAGVVIDDRVRGRASEDAARLADCLNQSARDENGAVFDVRIGA